MNRTSPTEVRRLARRLGVRPSKSLGQNFLIDRNILEILLDAADLVPGEGVLEIGPGLGVLTEALLERGCRVLAVEKDARLHAYLRDVFAGRAALDLRLGDFLDEDPAACVAQGYGKVVANLPYASGTRILVDLVTGDPAPSLLVVTLQQEVGDRLAAPAGGADYGMLSLWMQLDYLVQPVKRIGPTCFWPRPDVASAIVKAVRRDAPALCGAARQTFYALTRHCFRFRRKQMQTILRRWPGPGAVEALAACGIDPAARPQDIPLDRWCRLAASPVF